MFRYDDCVRDGGGMSKRLMCVSALLKGGRVWLVLVLLLLLLHPEPCQSTAAAAAATTRSLLPVPGFMTSLCPTGVS